MEHQDPPSLSAFTVFPNLPLELRILIWQKTLEPRVVEVTYDEETGFTTYSRLPMALQICKESRETVEPLYPCCFGSIFHPSRIRFNFALDTLYIDGIMEAELPHFLATFGEREINGIQTLALDEEAYAIPNELGEDYDITHGLRRAVGSLKGLKELLFVYDIENMEQITIDIGCGEQHDLVLYEDVPHELQEMCINPLMSPEDFAKEIAHQWKVPVCRPIIGWRRCPNAHPDEDWGRFGGFGYQPGLFDDSDTSMTLPTFLLHHMYMRGDDDYYVSSDDDDYDHDEANEDDEEHDGDGPTAEEDSWVDEESSDRESLD
jgi:hypothetical protein